MTRTATAARQHTEQAELYHRHQHDLLRAVARVVKAPPELIEDACQNAWTINLGTQQQPRRNSIFAWLRAVAIHEAYQLCRAELRDVPLEDLAHADGCEVLISAAHRIEHAIEARRALLLLAQLSKQQREDVSLLVAGFSYREIAEMTGGRTFTNVKKHLAKGRARLRQLNHGAVRPARGRFLGPE